MKRPDPDNPKNPHPIPRNNGRFMPGVSGNPRGRPRKEDRWPTNAQIFHDIVGTMEQTVTIVRNGRKVKVPAIMGVLDVALAKALKGDYRCIALVVDSWKTAIKHWTNANDSLIEAIFDKEDILKDALRRFPDKKSEIEAELKAFRESDAYKMSFQRTNLKMPKRK